MADQGFGPQSPELDAWMAARHDPKWKPTKTRRLPLRTARKTPASDPRYLYEVRDGVVMVRATW